MPYPLRVLFTATPRGLLPPHLTGQETEVGADEARGVTQLQAQTRVLLILKLTRFGLPFKEGIQITSMKFGKKVFIWDGKTNQGQL